MHSLWIIRQVNDVQLAWTFTSSVGGDGSRAAFSARCRLVVFAVILQQVDCHSRRDGRIGGIDVDASALRRLRCGASVHMLECSLRHGRCRNDGRGRWCMDRLLPSLLLDRLPGNDVNLLAKLPVLRLALNLVPPFRHGSLVQLPL